MRVEIRKRERLDLAEGLRAKIPHDVVGDTVVDHVLDPLCQRRQNGADAHDQEDPEEPAKGDGALADNAVDRASLQDRQIQREGADKGGHDDGQNNKTDIAVDVAENLPEDLPLIAGS